MLEQLELHVDQAQLFETSDYRLLDLVHVKLALFFLVTVVLEHVQLSLDHFLHFELRNFLFAVFVGIGLAHGQLLLDFLHLFQLFDG